MSEAPKKLYLTNGQDIHTEHPFELNDEGTYWCEDQINDGDPGYIREDIANALADAALALVHVNNRMDIKHRNPPTDAEFSDANYRMHLALAAYREAQKG